ncbi:MAG: phosphoribosylformylglycinamidine synthase [Clostridiales bacterium]|jgi:phosphoribosylformylglycinamidine synthase|nr:phosphoribosylformylglycinamidine synthase [Clostridiales bacterium]
MAIQRIFVEKKPGFDIESRALAADLETSLGITGIEGLKIVNRYTCEGIGESLFEQVKKEILSEAPADLACEGEYPAGEGEWLLAVKYLPGQYDQRADSAMQCIQLVSGGEASAAVESARIYAIKGQLSEEDKRSIEKYIINPVDSMKASLEMPKTLAEDLESPPDVEIIKGFASLDMQKLRATLGLSVSVEDLEEARAYFKKEGRDPTLSEIRVLDTYWSDHCRHTTFLTRLTDVKIEDKTINSVFQSFIKERGKSEDFCLMDVALAGMKALKKRGLLNDLDESGEVNACSINAKVDVDGEEQDWLVMFKNETHNHPTEIEPFGGAATCLGGAIRDPLSGRTWVYQAMRVTGSGDPRQRVEDTLAGKLPQKKITTEAARGYSSYGNQVGLATGIVHELYDPGYIAKRLEIGAVVGAAPKARVRREEPVPGDVVILAGGRTGRDGCGGATGSSKEHTRESILVCGAEVQKGNPPTERKLQRLFSNPKASGLIKRCNDFGAGGVAVAIGELAPGLDIDLDKVLKKYEGLDGTELAISESQERMAVVVSKEDAEEFMRLAGLENLEASLVATVTEDARLTMRWRGKDIIGLSREFLDTNGASQSATATIISPAQRIRQESADPSYWLENMASLENACQKGLSERFDSTIGAGTVLMPFGGIHQLTPIEAMVAKIPVQGETNTVTAMAFGCDPELAKWSPFHGASMAIVEAVAKLAATGLDFRKARLSLQEYFERMTADPLKWGKPLSALLGAYDAQMKLGIPAIGGKDSMSGTFMDLHVPPTLAAFALALGNADEIISPEFKKAGSALVRIKAPVDSDGLIVYESLAKNLDKIYLLAKEKKILSASAIGKGGIAAAVSKAALGNAIGATINYNDLYGKRYGDILIETELAETELEKALSDTDWAIIGQTQAEKSINANGQDISLEDIIQAWMPLEGVFPSFHAHKDYFKPTGEPHMQLPASSSKSPSGGPRFAKPQVFIPVFPGTNCELESARAFRKAGAHVVELVARNLNGAWLEETIKEMARLIDQSQMIMLPGGFSAGDEPDGSGKFIAAMFRNPRVKEATQNLLKNRDGLMLGICNGFQALIKLGLIEKGEISPQSPESATLSFNQIGRHSSCYVRTKVVSNNSPWLWNTKPGDEFIVPISHGEGRFAASDSLCLELARNGQIATQYVGLDGLPTSDPRFNPNGSAYAVEGVSSPDGRVLGKMGHSERIGKHIGINVPGEKDQQIFLAGVLYYK